MLRGSLLVGLVPLESPVSPLLVCTRFLAGFTFWSPFLTKRVDFPRENAIVWVTQTANRQ